MADSGLSTSKNIKTLVSLDTIYSADSVEWCPINTYENILLCGLYQLADQDGCLSSTRSDKRLGRLLGFIYNGETKILKKFASIDMAAVLDIKWCNHLVNDQPVFGIVTADGKLSLFELDRNSAKTTYNIIELCHIQLGTDRLSLSLDWSSTVCHMASPQIAVSDSKGDLHIVELSAGKLEIIKTWTAHDFEAWICAFNYWDPNVVYSGGDDCKLKMWDMRISTDMPVLTSKRHDMGVTSIQSAFLKENLLATGSYDNHVLIWDNRNMKRVISDTDTGGGVWRVKWDPYDNTQLLTASMYNGFHVMDCQKLQDSGQSIVASFMEHKSLAYGADWKRINEHQKKCDDSALNYVIATCSFYDHLLHLWMIDNLSKDIT